MNYEPEQLIITRETPPPPVSPPPDPPGAPETPETGDLGEEEVPCPAPNQPRLGTLGPNEKEKNNCESNPSKNKKIIILGGGPNRIGQGIEFDYCCCHACFALSKEGIETIMINCNPETVSTDYDTSDRLYFEPLTVEHVMEIVVK